MLSFQDSKLQQFAVKQCYLGVNEQDTCAPVTSFSTNAIFGLIGNRFFSDMVYYEIVSNNIYKEYKIMGEANNTETAIILALLKDFR